MLLCWAELVFQAHFHMLLSSKLKVSSVKVTCSGWCLEHCASFVLECVHECVFTKSVLVSVLFSLLLRSSSWESCRRVCSVEVEHVLLCTESPQLPIPCPASRGYKYVCDVLITSGSSGRTSDGKSRDTNDVLWTPLLQLNSVGLLPWLRPPIRQKRHLTFSRIFCKTVFLSRM